jgi:spermidine synthase
MKTTIPSKKNGTLELTYLDGRLVLDSENANYSYGSLQEVLKLGLQQLSWDQNGRALVLGLGGGSVVETLVEEFGHQGPIVGVEYDEELIAIAHEEFNLDRFSSLTVVIDDAFRWSFQNNQVFDLIIIDVFNDALVHPKVFDADFVDCIEQKLAKNGVLLINAGMEGVDQSNWFKWKTVFHNLVRQELKYLGNEVWFMS